MRYKKMPNEKFEFTTNSLSYGVIEDRILNFYDLGYANSSDFMELEEGMSSNHYITATKGIIEFRTTVGKTPDGLYLVICYPISVKKQM